MKTVRILSIDGGGMRDLYATIIWNAIQKASGGLHARDLFDLVVGTSGGAWIGGALVKPRPLTGLEIMNMFIREGKEIFQADLFRRMASVLHRPRYSSEGVEAVLDNVFGDAWLSDVEVPFMATAYEHESRKAQFFKSWKARGQELDPGDIAPLHNYRLRDVMRASSAAITYFPPARIMSQAGVYSTFIDGAFSANNPAMCAIASARIRWPDARRIILVSIGTGQQTDAIPYARAVDWGLINWAQPAFECLMDGTADATAYQVEHCFGEEVRQYRFDFELGAGGPSAAIDDASSEQVRKLIIAGDSSIHRYRHQIEELPGLLMAAAREA